MYIVSALHEISYDIYIYIPYRRDVITGLCEEELLQGGRGHHVVTSDGLLLLSKVAKDIL